VNHIFEVGDRVKVIERESLSLSGSRNSAMVRHHKLLGAVGKIVEVKDEPFLLTFKRNLVQFDNGLQVRIASEELKIVTEDDAHESTGD
jgi:hypothetical protein